MNMQLPSVTPNQATLPQTYEAAKAALAECQAMDECQQWADKAAALASYAKQAEDETLMKMAARIKARAVRRAGELLKQIEPATGTTKKEGDRLFSRADAAREAGMSEHQQKQATRIASVSEQDFEAAVESDEPPTLSQLAQQGIKPRPVVDLKGRDPKEFNKAMHFVGDFEHTAREIGKHDTAYLCSILTPEERQRLRAAINRIDAAHDEIMTRI